MGPKINIKLAKIVVILAVAGLLAGCMNMRIVAQYDSNNPVPVSETRWVLFWGLMQPNDINTDEHCESICNVTTKSTIGHILISTATLGIAVPLSVEYECCAFEPPIDEL